MGQQEQVAQFEELLTQECLGIAWRYCCRLVRTRQDAEDLLQESLAHAFTRLHQLNDTGSFKSWLMSIVRSRFLMQYRRKTADKLIVDKDSTDTSYTIADRSSLRNDDPRSDLTLAALGQLPDGQRQILELFYIEELTLAETARVLRVSQGAVQQRLFRARGALKRQIQRQQPIPAESFSSR